MGDRGSIPGLGKSPGEGNGYLLQYCCLGKSHGQRRLVGCSPRGHQESDMTEWLNTLTNALWGLRWRLSIKDLPAMWETPVYSPGQEDSQRRKQQPVPVSLAGELHGQRSLAGYSPWDFKVSDVTEWLTLSHKKGGQQWSSKSPEHSLNRS